jgi:uncharacterized membrane protein
VTAAFTDINAGTSAAAPPCRPPCSRIPFSTLGRFGQRFISESPTLTELTAFGGRSAVRPLRIYAGLRSAPTLRAEADLIVAELERLGGFDRKTLLIATSTGTGWVDPNAVAALEYMYNGDTAAVSMQYSSLPSPVSFVVDRSEVTRASRVLLRQVRAAWLRRPAQTRPKLLVFGESLGALGSQSSFRDLADVTRRVDGALWEGSPANAPLFAAHPSTSPTPAGVLFADHATMLHRLRRLHPVKVVFLQHPSDPVPRWSPDLLVRRPNWLRGGPAGRGDDVSARMRWYPLVTFLQVTADLAWATRVPRGHGHNYHVDAADGWARIVPAPGWTTRDTRRLREALAHRARL